MKRLDDFKMVIHNSGIVVNDYDWGTCPTLENQFSTWDPVRHKREYLGIYYDKVNRKLYLPRGLDIEWAKRKIATAMEDPMEFTSTIVHSYPYQKTKEIKVKLAPRDDVQKEALEFMLCNKRYACNAGAPALSLNLTTGKGKTYICAVSIAFMRVKSMIITAQSGILDQWEERIMDYTNLDHKDILKIEGSGQIRQILNDKSQSLALNKQIYLCTHSTLHSYGCKYGWDKVYDLFKKLGIGFKIFDEAHQCFSNMALIDYATLDVARTAYITATPSRSDRDEDKIFKIYMKNVPSITLFNPDVDQHTGYIAIKFNSMPKPSDIIACKSNFYGLNLIAYIDYLTRNERFWAMFDYIFSLIYISGGRALFYIGTNAAIKKVYDRIMYNYPELRDDVGIYTSISEDKAYAKTKKYILTTTKSAGAGEDIAHLKYSVVLAEPFRSEVLARQTLGRTRDPDTLYIELVDVGFKQIGNFYNAKKSIFNKYASSFKVMNVEPARLENLIEDTRIKNLTRFSYAMEFNVTGGLEAVSFMSVPSMPAVYFGNNTLNRDLNT